MIDKPNQYKDAQMQVHDSILWTKCVYTP